jgi:2-amino-4-hydroxy-6-hydroxymethyldihydropteridine diphosphokinase
MYTLALFSLGSNIHPEYYLPEAVRRLAAHGYRVRASRVYQTRPVGSTHQPDYLNAAVALETNLPAEYWFETIIPGIEAQLGRQRDLADKYAPRTIDVDLVMYGDWVGSLAGHILPHPDILTRWFVALPLSEVAPHTRHPTDGRTLEEIATDLRRHVDEPLRIRTDVPLVDNACG